MPQTEFTQSRWDLGIRIKKVVFDNILIFKNIYFMGILKMCVQVTLAGGKFWLKPQSRIRIALFYNTYQILKNCNFLENI